MTKAEVHKPGIVDKLVGDKVPDMIKAEGNVPIIHIATGNEYTIRLRRKLSEEVDALLRVKTPDQLDEKIGDVLEVLRSYAQLGGRDMKTIEAKRQAKYTTHGGFSRGIVLEKVEEGSRKK